MDKIAYVLQTTRTGRLPTNALFADEGSARAETERAVESGAFEHIRLITKTGSVTEVLFERGQPRQVKARSPKGKGQAAGRQKKRVSSAQVIKRLSAIITISLIFVVLIYAAQSIMLK
jgi:hypothetical protein